MAVQGFETLTDVHWTMSGLVILMTLVGGMGTMSGPMLGAVLIIALENKLGDFGNFMAARTGIDWFTTLGEAVSMVTGLIFVACVLLFRRGIIGEIVARWRPAADGTPPAAPAPAAAENPVVETSDTRKLTWIRSRRAPSCWRWRAPAWA